MRSGGKKDFQINVFIPEDRQITDVTFNTDYVPPGVNISFDIAPRGNPRAVKVNLEVVQCPKERNMTGPWSVLIGTNVTPQKVKLQITLMCHCDCPRTREENSSACSGNGALVCGHCECYEPYFGKRCQRRGGSISSQDDRVCRSGPDAPVCSGRGTCEEGGCYCHAPANPKEKYYGQFCECSDFECPRYNKKVCGGRGKCECQQCVCDEDWTGEDCSCSMDVTNCIANNQQLCNGNGLCQCGQCVCEPPFSGPTCEECPTCSGLCQRTAPCVECRAFGTGEMASRCDQECSALSLSTVENKQDLLEIGDGMNLCKYQSRADSCLYFFVVTRAPPGAQVTVVRSKQCPVPHK